MKTGTAMIGMAAILLLTGCASEDVGSTRLSCKGRGGVEFHHKSELPPGAAAAAGLEGMADVGEPMNASDVVIAIPGHPERSAPMERFIDAEQTGCRLVICYEQGGIGYSHVRIVLRQTAAGWRVESKGADPQFH